MSMSPVDIQVSAQKKDDILVTVLKPIPAATIQVATLPGLQVIAAGNVGPPGPASTVPGPQGIQGPPGPPGEWTQMTQAAYDALLVKDPETLYVIIG